MAGVLPDSNCKSQVIGLFALLLGQVVNINVELEKVFPAGIFITEMIFKLHETDRTLFSHSYHPP